MIPDLPRIRKSPDWHEQRRKGIGGSDWAAILSEHYPREYPYSCLRRLWYSKRGINPDFPENTSRAAMRGNILEPVVAELFQAHTGCTFTEDIPKATELYPDQPIPEWWIGNPDFIAVMPTGKTEGLECKTMGKHVWLKFIENGLPTSYQIQPQHYMGLTGLETFHVAVIWSDGLEFQTEPVHRNVEMLRLMFDAGEYFQKKVLRAMKAPGRQPISEQRCSSCQYARRCLGQSYWQHHELDLVDLSCDDKLYEMLRKLQDIKTEGCTSKEKDDLQRAIQEHITETNGEDVEWFFCREIEVSWKKTLGSRFQKEELLADEPALAPKFLEYTKFFPRRTFSSKVSKRSSSRWEVLKSAS